MGSQTEDTETETSLVSSELTILRSHLVSVKRGD